MILNITQNGKRQAKDVQGKGIEQSILTSLDEHGPASLQEVSSDIGVEEYKVRDAAAKLANDGFLRKEE